VSSTRRSAASELHAGGAGGVEFEGGAVVEAGAFVAGDGGGVVNRRGRPEGAPADEGAEGERGGEAGPCEGARPAAGGEGGGGRGRREGNDGCSAVEGGVELGSIGGELGEEAEGLLEPGDGGGVARIGAEPLGEFAFACERKTVVALGEPGDGSVFEGRRRKAGERPG
jgi:hypothetical protein